MPESNEVVCTPDAEVLLPAAPAGRAPVLALRTLDEQLRFAEIVVTSGLALGHKNAASVVIAINYGMELGLQPTQALRMVNVIKDRPTLSADGYVAVVVGHPSRVCTYFVEVEGDEQHSTWETQRVGAPPRRYTFTMDDAKRAQLTGRSDMYGKFPKRMLSARAKAFLARDVYPDLVGGLLSDEEAHAIPAAPATTYRQPQRKASADRPPAVEAAPAPRLVIDAHPNETIVVPALVRKVAEAVVDAPGMLADGHPPLELTPDDPLDAPASRQEIVQFIAACKEAGKSEQRVKDYLLAKYRLKTRKDIPVGIVPDLMVWAREGQ